MNKYFLSFLFAAFFFLETHCQVTFNNFFSGNNKRIYGYSICSLPSNRFAVTGKVHDIGTNTNNLLIAMIDNTGDTLWTRVLHDTIDLNGEEIIFSSDSNIIVTGTRGQELLFLKLNLSGQLLVEKSFQVSSDYSLWNSKIVTAVDSGIFIAADYSVFITGFSNTLILKLNLQGNIEWQKILFRDFGSNFRSIIPVDFGYVACTGNIIVKMNNLGVVQWAHSFNFGSTLEGYDINKTNDNGFIMTGRIDRNPIWIEGFLLKADSSGNFQWSTGFGAAGSFDLTPFDVFQKSNGNYLLFGDLHHNLTYQCGMIETDSLGTALFYNGYQNWRGYTPSWKTISTTDGFAICTSGKNPILSNSICLWVSKINGSGNTNCSDTSMAMSTEMLNPIIQDPILFSDSSIAITSQVVLLIDDPSLAYNSYCSTVGLSEFTSNLEFSIFPNPAENNFTVILNNEIKETFLEVYNVIGKRVFLTTLNSKQQTINTKFPPGIYIIKVYNDGKQFSEKLIIQ